MPNDLQLFPHREPNAYYDFGVSQDVEFAVDEISDHRWRGKALEYQVHFVDGDVTWESNKNCQNLTALDEYLELQGVKHPEALLKRGKTLRETVEDVTRPKRPVKKPAPKRR